MMDVQFPVPPQPEYTFFNDDVVAAVSMVFGVINLLATFALAVAEIVPGLFIALTPIVSVLLIYVLYGLFELIRKIYLYRKGSPHKWPRSAWEAISRFNSLPDDIRQRFHQYPALVRNVGFNSNIYPLHKTIKELADENYAKVTAGEREKALLSERARRELIDDYTERGKQYLEIERSDLG